ncbi:MAG TPA: hypothetical protein VMV91_09170 [Rhodocyclaceae bacterium]|nr:hypothetical protein [Rhodocyclaceae bacterium]
MKIPLLFCLAIAAALPAWAASPKTPRQRLPPFVADLSPIPIRHGALCPLPSQGLCVIKKPVGKRYRVLSTGAELDDMGDYWIADFSKSKDSATGRELLRILAENGDLHEIEVRFPRPPVVKAKPAVKPAETKKEAVKEPSEEQTP